MKTIHIIDNKITFKNFKRIQAKLVKQSIIPLGADKAIWHLLRDKKIVCGFADDMANDMWISVDFPKRYKNHKCFIIKNKNRA